ncbi:MAG: AMP-binding protein [Xenococcaceae cyanobacterium MO_234.B1]|nr:AMP-binding protein [Xenococcaceae cyanobacterium MO_234.B1]
MAISSPVDYHSLQSLPEVWSIAAQKFSNTKALVAPHLKPQVSLTYRELYQKIQQFGIGLQTLGVQPQDKIALFADNSPRWFIGDQGIMTAGGVDVVRSSTAEKQELLYIYEDSDSTALVVEDSKTLDKLRPEIDNLPLKFIILLSDETVETNSTTQVYNFPQLLELGTTATLNPVPTDKNTLATLIYTSGTTGKPKGAMLSHGNLLHQVNYLYTIIQCQPGDRVVSILPSWHVYERSAEYFLLSQGCTQYYTNLRSLKSDLKKYQPHYMVGVPRLWESLYEGVQKQFRDQPASKQKLINWFFNVSEQYIKGKRISQGLSLEHLEASVSEKLLATIKAICFAPIHSLGDKIVYQKVREAVGGEVKSFISGGGSLAKHLDDFYEIVSIPVLVGYGLTETSPVTNARKLERNFRQTAGQPIPETEIKIVDPTTGETLPTGETGLVLIRGSQVMQGYYKKPEATAKAIDPEGWFDSGDLGWVTPNKDLVLTGRAKDTIVLTNGENIEPQPIEDACVRSTYIDQIMLVGQDQRSLGALIVPNLETVEQWIATEKLDLTLPSPDASPETIANSDLYSRPIQDLFRQELNREVQNRPGYRPDDRIGPFKFILEPFSKDNCLMTQTLKIKRPVVRERYQYLIKEMY